MLTHLWFLSSDFILYETEQTEGETTPEMGRLHLLVQVLPWRAITAMQRGPKHLISAHSFVKESSLKGHGFYGALLCLFHCALLRRGEKTGREPTDQGGVKAT